MTVRGALTLVLVLGTAACAPFNPEVIKVPVPVPCVFTLPAKPVPYVEQVALTGHPETDALAVFRAMEAELEARRAYEVELEAAVQACRGGKEDGR